MNTLVIEFDGEDIEINVPTSWDEITIKQTALLSSVKLTSATTRYDVFKDNMEILCGIDNDISGAMSQSEMEKVEEWLDMIGDYKIGEHKEFIEVEGEKYYLYQSFDKFTNAEIISIKMIEEKHGSNKIYAIPEMLCIFLRKKLENGSLETFRNSFMDRARLFENLIITDVNRMFDFFTNGKSKSLTNIPGFSQKQQTSKGDQ